MQQVFFQDLGDMAYQQAWDYQTALHRDLVAQKMALRNGTPPPSPLPHHPSLLDKAHHLLFVEHPPVYTLGKSGSMDNLLLSEAELQEKGISFFPINRGGDITFHGPGQLVGYPILDLDLFFNDVHRYVRNLEEVMIRTLAEYGLEGFRIKDYTGVWVAGGQGAGEFWAKKRKICAIGVHLSRWITLHGWAFNVDTPLHYFDYIVPCGIAEPDKTVTSLSVELGHPVDMTAVKASVRRHFEAVFECVLVF